MFPRKAMHVRFATFWLLLSGLFLLAGCGDDGDDLVAISGAVMNIDLGVPARDVVVSLLGHSDEYSSEPTGSDGLFFLEVPRGSPFHLVTNDWAGLDKDSPAAPSAVADDWITFINLDPAISVVTDNVEAIIHACPSMGSPHTWFEGTEEGLGSVAVWQNFIDNSDTAPLYTDATDLTGKIVGFAAVGTPPNEDMGFPFTQITGISLGVEEAFGKVGYWDALHVFNDQIPGLEGTFVQDASLGPDIFVEGATSNGPGISLAMIFGNTGFSGNTAILTFADTKTERGIDFSSVSPLEIPLRDMATTFVGIGFVDNVPTTLLNGLCAAGMPVPFCD